MHQVGVVGCGLMGSGIAEVCARAGLDVLVVETSAAAAKTALARLEASLTRAEQRGKIDDAHAVLGRIVVSTNLDDMADREIVIEAIAPPVPDRFAHDLP